MKSYVLKKEYVEALRQYIASKTLIDTVKTEMTEQEINAVLNYIAQFPYSEVQGFFNASSQNIHEKVEQAPAPAPAPEEKSKPEKNDKAS